MKHKNSVNFTLNQGLISMEMKPTTQKSVAFTDDELEYIESIRKNTWYLATFAATVRFIVNNSMAQDAEDLNLEHLED